MPQGISGYTFILNLDGVAYDYRISADGTILFPCSPPPVQTTPQPPTLPVGAACPAGFAGFLPPRLEVGGMARINEGGIPNRLRDAPSINATQISVIEPGTTVDVIGGPSCEDASHIIWWRISADDVVGWTAEGVLPDDYFLAPLGTGLLAERSLIIADTVELLVPLTTIPVSGVTSMSFTTDGTKAAFGGTAGLTVYNMSSLTINSQISDASAPVTAVAFSPDGRYLAYSTTNHRLWLYDTVLSARVGIQRQPNDQINDLSFSYDTNYLLALATGDQLGSPDVSSAVEMYNLSANEGFLQRTTPSWVRDTAFSPDGELFAWLDMSLHVIEVAGAADVTAVALEQPPNAGLAWRPTPIGSIPTQEIAFADGVNVRLLNISTNVEQTYFADPDFLPDTIGFNQDGSLLAAMNVSTNSASGSVVNIFDVVTSDLITQTVMEASTAMTFTPDGTLLVIVTADEVIFLGVAPSDLAVG
jgi:WD40 repeat protein